MRAKNIHSTGQAVNLVMKLLKGFPGCLLFNCGSTCDELAKGTKTERVGAMVAMSMNGRASLALFGSAEGTVVSLALGTTWIPVFISKAKEPKNNHQPRHGARPEPQEVSKSVPIQGGPTPRKSRKGGPALRGVATAMIPKMEPANRRNRIIMTDGPTGV